MGTRYAFLQEVNRESRISTKEMMAVGREREVVSPAIVTPDLESDYEEAFLIMYELMPEQITPDKFIPRLDKAAIPQKIDDTVIKLGSWVAQQVGGTQDQEVILNLGWKEFQKLVGDTLASNSYQKNYNSSLDVHKIDTLIFIQACEKAVLEHFGESIQDK